MTGPGVGAAPSTSSSFYDCVLCRVLHSLGEGGSSFSYSSSIRKPFPTICPPLLHHSHLIPLRCPLRATFGCLPHFARLTLPISLFTLHRLPRFPARVALRASLRSVYLGSPLASVHHSPFDSASLPPPGNLRLSVLLRSAHSSYFTFHSSCPPPLRAALPCSRAVQHPLSE